MCMSAIVTNVFEGGEMDLIAKALDHKGVCDNCETRTYDVFVLLLCGTEKWLCLKCVLFLRDLAHEATCEKDVTGKCDCWEGEDG